MDSLGALGDALAAPARLRPPAAAGGGGDADLPDVLQHSGVVQEVYARHGRSAQPESRQVIAILQAVLEVLKAEGLPPTPTALFAALMSRWDGHIAHYCSCSTALTHMAVNSSAGAFALAVLDAADAAAS